MRSSTKPELDNILQVRIVPEDEQAAVGSMRREFGEVGETGRQTDALITIFRSPTGGGEFR